MRGARAEATAKAKGARGTYYQRQNKENNSLTELCKDH